MTITIRETGEARTLSIIDRETGVNYADDIIGSSGAIGESITFLDGGGYCADLKTVEWWEKYLAEAQTDNDALDKLRERYGAQTINDLLADLNPYGPDYENHHAEAQKAIAEIKAALEARMNERTSIKNQIAASQTEADRRNAETAAAKDPQEPRPEKTAGRTGL